MEPIQAEKMLELLAAAYPDRADKISGATMEIYLRCLHDLPFEALQIALLNHITSNKWFPTVAELRQLALEAMPGGRAPTALEAWGEVTKLIVGVGSYKPQPKFSHPAIDKAVSAMGWIEICRSENQVADRAHFLRMYETYCHRLQGDLLTLPEVKQLAARLAEKLALQQSNSEASSKILQLSDAKRMAK